MRFDKSWQKDFNNRGMSEAATEIKKIADNNPFCEDDGEWYKDWIDFKLGNAIAWPKNPKELTEDYPKNQQEAVQIFFKGFDNRIKDEMKRRSFSNFKVREPMCIFPDEEVRKYHKDHIGFYGWVTVVIPKE